MNRCFSPLLIITTILFQNITGGYADDPYRGWGYLVQKLEADGFTERELGKVFTDPRLPVFEGISFSLAPREKPSMYKSFVNKQRIDRGLRCLQENDAAFRKAEKVFKVSRFVIGALLLVETQCGDFTGKNLVLFRIARLASVRDADSLEKVYRKLHAEDLKVTRKEVTDRAQYLENTFYPEVISFLRMVKQEHLDPFSLSGSSSGAFGIAQFLPSSFIHYAIDGNGNGVTSLFEIEDAIFSIGFYLSKEGWRNESSLSEKRDAIWKYNKSTPYIDTVMKVAAIFEQGSTKKVRK